MEDIEEVNKAKENQSPEFEDLKEWAATARRECQGKLLMEEETEIDRRSREP